MTKLLMASLVVAGVAISLRAQSPNARQADQQMQKMQLAMADAQAKASRPGDNRMSCAEMQQELEGQMRQPAVRAAAAANGAIAQEKLDEYTSPDRGWVDRSLPPRDRLASVFFAGNVHDEAQPVHLKVQDTSICVTRCTKEFGNPCENFCPAGVYEMVADGQGGRRLQINAANCVHCKACDIKDPYEIITWTTPEGGSGPNYQNL